MAPCATCDQVTICLECRLAVPSCCCVTEFLNRHQERDALFSVLRRRTNLPRCDLGLADSPERLCRATDGGEVSANDRTYQQARVGDLVAHDSLQRWILRG